MKVRIADFIENTIHAIILSFIIIAETEYILINLLYFY